MPVHFERATVNGETATTWQAKHWSNTSVPWYSADRHCRCTPAKKCAIQESDYLKAEPLLNDKASAGNISSEQDN